ncbi:hypothetical protein BTR25_05060 [Bacillus sp. MRMR6]|nr:hypothetical protein BTR25_05060 [Bacillus sp. MRMR6]
MFKVHKFVFLQILGLYQQILDRYQQILGLYLQIPDRYQQILGLYLQIPVYILQKIEYTQEVKDIY